MLVPGAQPGAVLEILPGDRVRVSVRERSGQLVAQRIEELSSRQ
jgi:hypothetical protein